MILWITGTILVVILTTWMLRQMKSVLDPWTHFTQHWEENDHSGQFSSKGKTPWIAYNDCHVADSQLSIEFLKETLSIDLDKDLDENSRSVAWAFRELTEENLYWTMCYEAFVKSPESLDILMKDIYPAWKIFMFKKAMGWTIKKELWGQGIGRHSDDEIWYIAQRDLGALSKFLGTKSFMLGDTPHEVDCAVFGMLSMVVWEMKGLRHERLVHEKLPNLVAYCERMRDRFWPDWEQRCKGNKYENDHGTPYLP